MNRATTRHLVSCTSVRIALRLAVGLLAIAVSSHVARAQLTMLHASGRNIVNANGQTVVLKGVNLGGLFVMER